MSKVICVGYFDRGNCGDEAFKVAHEWMFGAENVIFKNGKIDRGEVHGLPVVLGGGDVVAPFFLDWIPDGVPFDMLGVGLKYEQSSINAIRAKGDAFGAGWFRNHIDVTLCEDAGIKAAYIPDIVFALRDSFPKAATAKTSSLLGTDPKPMIAVCLADHFNSRNDLSSPKHAAYLEYFKWELAATLDSLSSDYQIVFLPFSVYENHMDHRFHFDVSRRMRYSHKVILVREKLHPVEMFNVVAQMDTVMSMKLHGNIFGLVAKKKCINIGVGRKQQKLYEEANLGEVSLDPFSFTKERLMRLKMASERSDIVSKVSELADSNYEAIVQVRSMFRERYGIAN